MTHLVALGQYVQTHVLVILISIVAGMAVGFLWHGPLFGKVWMKYNKLTPKKGEATLAMMLPGLIAGVVMIFVQATVMGRTFELLALAHVGHALLIATVLWLPFTALTIVNSYAWLGKPVGHMVLDAGYNLASMWAVAAILFYMA